MKITKKKIIKAWNEDYHKKKYKVKLNYKNWEEIYNQNAKIIAGVIFKKDKKIFFEIFNNNQKILIQESTLENIGKRQITGE